MVAADPRIGSTHNPGTRITVLVMMLATLAGLSAYSEPESLWWVDDDAYGTLPLGSSADVFTVGAGAKSSCSYVPGFLRIVGIKTGGSFLSIPLDSPIAGHGVWTISGFTGPVVRVALGERFSLQADAQAGYYQWGGRGWDAREAAGGGLLLTGRAGAAFKASGNFTLGARVNYDYYTSLYNGLGMSVSLTFVHSGMASPTGKVLLEDIHLNPLFPAFHSYYTSHPVGRATVVNTGKTAAKNVSILLYVERYMDNPMTVGATFNLAAGERKSIDLFALFTEDLMEITEGTKISAKVSTAYASGQNEFISDHSAVLEFYNRNAMMWDDDRKIASFITSNDPEIMNFAKNVGTWLQAVKNPAIDENQQKGMALFEAGRAYGIRYEIDPATPFSKLSEDEQSIDFLQFPRQTLQYTNGDRDDLTALYTSLLEAIGLETAFIAIPGHIYAAFALKSSEANVRKSFGSSSELIFLCGKVWLPVETTMFQYAF